MSTDISVQVVGYTQNKMGTYLFAKIFQTSRSFNDSLEQSFRKLCRKRMVGWLYWGLTPL